MFKYDGAARLSEATSYPTGLGLPSASAADSLDYDEAGNRDDDVQSAQPWSYNDNNEILFSPTPGGGSDTSYAFDDDGNVLSSSILGDSEARLYTFDKVNRLEGFVDEKSGANVTFAYDPFGRRVRKTDVGAGATTWFVWHGDQLLAEYDQTGVRNVRYAYAGGFAPAQVAYTDAQCDDGVDNDGDGDLDAADSDCASEEDFTEGPAPAASQCSDGINNDGDQWTDFSGGDPDCDSADDTTEGPWHDRGSIACRECYARRRPVSAMPKSPRPSMAAVVGSGTICTVSTLGLAARFGLPQSSMSGGARP